MSVSVAPGRRTVMWEEDRSVTSAPNTHMLRADNCFYAWWRLRALLGSQNKL